MVTKIIVIGSMTGMIIVIIWKGDHTMIGMNIGEMIIKVQHKRTPDNIIIDRIGIKIFQHRRITVVNNNKGVVITINRIDPTTNIFISQKRHDNFNMILRENIRMDVHNMNRVKAVDHSLLTAICAGNMDIMQINVPLK